mgnify:FL=1
MEFKEYLAIIRRRWLLFFPIFLLIIGTHMTWVSYLQKNRFTATSKVVIGNDDTARASGLESFPSSPWKGLSRNTKEATLGDYPVLRRAAELARGDMPFLSPQFVDGKLGSRIEESTVHVRSLFGDGEEELERLIEVIQGSLSLEALNDGQIVAVNCEGADDIAPLVFSWAVSEAASQFHTEKARENVSRDLDDLDVRIRTAEAEFEQSHIALASAQQETGIANFDDKQRVILDTIYRLEEQDSKLQASLRKNDRLIQYRLQQQGFGVGQAIEADLSSLEQSPELTQIRGRLIDAKITLDTKLGTLSHRNPEVQEAQAIVAGLEKLLAESQDRLLNDRYKDFTHETNDFIKENTLFGLERQVLAERIGELNSQLIDLNRQRQTFAPVEFTFVESQKHLEELKSTEKKARWIAAGQLGSVMVHDPAMHARPVMTAGTGVGPLTLTVLMAFIFALGVVYVVEYVDTRVKSEHDIRRYLNLPLLGIIPKENGPSRVLTDAPPQSEISEKFNTAATLIMSASKELNLRSLMVCSAIAREGKTTVSVNLAVALARKVAKVVLIDGDLRLSQVHNLLGVSNHVGLSNVLDGKVSTERMIEGVMSDEDFHGRQVSALSVVQRSHVPNLDVIASGPATSDPVQLLESGRLSKVIAELKQQYDFVIFDTPPINKVGDALTISSCVDGSVFVVGSGQAEQQDVAWAKHLLSNVQANVLGVFLNKFSKQRGGEYYYYYSDSKRRRRSRSFA